MDKRYRVYRAWAMQRFIKQTGFAPSFHWLRYRVLEAAIRDGGRIVCWRGCLGQSPPHSLEVRKPKRISRGSQIRARALLL